MQDQVIDDMDQEINVEYHREHQEQLELYIYVKDDRLYVINC
jgi:hypothetical protein